MKASTIRPAWLPPTGTIAARPAGKNWDAITIDGPTGWSALMYLAELAPTAPDPSCANPAGRNPGCG